MAQDGSGGLTPLWRAEGPLPNVPPLTPRGRGWKIALALLLLVGLLATLGGVLSWLRPVPQTYFSPLIVRDYPTPFPFLAMAGKDADGLRRANLFPNTDLGALHGPDKARLLHQLDHLQGLQPTETAVVYLAAHACFDERGGVALLPAGASPDDPATWLPLRTVLERLKACPAKNRLLILDIMQPLTDPRLGLVSPGIAAAIPAELDQVPDAGRLVLCPCAPGQEALVCEELQRSPFSYYFEEGLRGFADGYGPTGRRDRKITVQELAGFLQARVDRWARLNRGARQAPVLYGEGNFPLIVLQKPHDHLSRPTASVYPDWLSAAWERWDASRSDPLASDPRLRQRRQAILLEMDHAWRNGADEETLRKSGLALLEKLEEKPAPFKVHAVSIAQEALQGKRPDPAVLASLEELMAKAFKSGKPEETAKARLRWSDEFRARTQEKSDLDLEGAVVHWVLRENAGAPVTLRFLDNLLRRPGKAGPRYAEALALRQLADLLERVPVRDWSAEQAVQFLQFAVRAEEAEADPLSLGPLLDEALQARQGAAVRFLAPGFVSSEDKERWLRDAAEKYHFLAEMDQKIRQAHLTLERALDWLASDLPEREETKSQGEMALVAGKLDQALRFFPPPSLSIEEWRTQRGKQVEGVEGLHRRLEELLRDQSRPYEKPNLDRALLAAQLAGAGPLQWNELDALLAAPPVVLKARDRMALWQARQALAGRLLEVTLKLDREEDDHQRLTPDPEPFAEGPALRKERDRALARAAASLALAQTGGFSPTRLDPVRAAWKQAKAQPDQRAAWGKLGILSRSLWARGLREQFLEEKSLPARITLAHIAPPREELALLEGEKGSLALELRLQARQKHWARLSDHYRYLARDWHGLGLDSAGLRDTGSFYHQAAAANPDLAKPGPESFVVLRPVRPLGQPLPLRAADAHLEVQRNLPPGIFGPVEVTLHRPDDAWLLISPASASLAKVKQSDEPRVLNSQVPLQVGLKPGADSTGLPRPAGFLAAAHFEGRTYHHLVAVPLPGVPPDIQVLASPNPKEPDPLLPELRLRPGKARQAFFLYLRNPLDVPRKVQVELRVGDVPLGSSRVEMALPGKMTQRVPLPDLPTPDPLPELTGPLQVRVIEVETGQLLGSRTIPIAVASPREYVQIKDVRLHPAADGHKNKLIVQVQTALSVAGPPIPVRLVLPREPSLGLGESGTLRAELPAQAGSPPATLVAEGLEFPDEEGAEYYLEIDGISRALAFRVPASPPWLAVSMRTDSKPHLRLPAVPYAVSSPHFTVRLEVDHPPPASTLEVSLCRRNGDKLEADLVRRFSSPEKRQIGFSPQGGGLLFEANIRDHEATFDTRLFQGERVLRARLLDDRGEEILHTLAPLVLDATPPGSVRLDLPPRVKRGTLLKLAAHGLDPESGIETVQFYLGSPLGDQPPKGGVSIVARPSPDAPNRWEAQLPLPADRKGTVPVSVCFINKAGLSRWETVPLELLDDDPARIGPGVLLGKVTEGDRPQPNLDVLLLDEKGREKARTRTRPDGTYQFDNLAAGRYQVYCVKPESLRQGRVFVEMGPGERKSVHVPLEL